MVISDGGDNASEHKRAEMLDKVSKSLATIYAVGIYDAEDTDRDPGILKDVAKISGGEAFFPKLRKRWPEFAPKSPKRSAAVILWDMYRKTIRLASGGFM